MLVEWYIVLLMCIMVVVVVVVMVRFEVVLMWGVCIWL